MINIGAEERVRTLLADRGLIPWPTDKVRELALELIEQLYAGSYAWKGAQLERFAVSVLAALGVNVATGTKDHR